jgi:hypothetical protein
MNAPCQCAGLSQARGRPRFQKFCITWQGPGIVRHEHVCGFCRNTYMADPGWMSRPLNDCPFLADAWLALFLKATGNSRCVHGLSLQVRCAECLRENGEMTPDTPLHDMAT